MSYAAYLRVSRPDQAEPDHFGLDVQRHAIETYVTQHPGPIVAWYADEGLSGATLERPRLQQLLRDAACGAFRAVLVAKMDRLARELLAQLWLEKELLRASVELISIAEPVRGQDAASVLFRQIIGAFAQFEKARITERLSGGRQAKARQGGYAGGVAPLGYQARRGAKQLHVEPVGAAVVRRLFALRTAHPTWSLQRLADALNAEGLRTAQGKPFRRMQVKRMLEREALYRGMYRYGGIEAPGQHAPVLAAWPGSPSAAGSNGNPSHGTACPGGAEGGKGRSDGGP